MYREREIQTALDIYIYIYIYIYALPACDGESFADNRSRKELRVCCLYRCRKHSQLCCRLI